jgi:hypothetical protein
MSTRRPKGKLIGTRTKFESVVKRLFCTECGAMRDARKVGRSAEYTLACGHMRMLMSSEKEVAPCRE